MITYRLATASDAAQVVSLLQEIIVSHGVTPPEPGRLHATLAAILEAPEHIVLVAETEDRLAGMCALIFSQSTWSASPVCELQDVVVTQDYRRTDVGRGLMRAAEEIATFCQRNYGVTFPMFSKLVTKAGPDQSPIYTYLGATGNLPGWNFSKYLVGKDGTVKAFFPSKVTPEDPALRKAIDEALGS